MTATKAAAPTWRDNRLVQFVEQRPIWFLMLAGLVLRLWLAHYDGLQPDLRLYQRWAVELSYDGPADYYDTAFTDYLPVYLYVLAGIGLIARLVGGFGEHTWWYAFKIPPILADLASAYLLYLVLATKPERTRLLAAATYLFLPTVLFIGAFWGQSDSLLAFGLLICVYFVSKGRPVSTALTFTVVFWFKPLAIATLPVLAIWILRDYKPKVWVQCVLAAFAVTLVLVLPFYPGHPWNMFNELQDDTSNTTFTSLYAYNLFGIFGWFRADNAVTFGITWHTWGWVLFAIAELFIVLAFFDAKKPGTYALGVALSMLASYTFLTRMHERYMFAAFLPLLVACVFYNRKLLWGSFVVLSVAQLSQLYIAYYKLSDFGPPVWMKSGRLVDWLNWSPDSWTRPGSLVEAVLSALVVAVVIALIVYAYLANFRIRLKGGFHVEVIPGEQLP